MGWFSKSTNGFLLRTTTPTGIELHQQQGVVNGMVMVAASGTAVKR
jgi:hypothetical protein